MKTPRGLHRAVRDEDLIRVGGRVLGLVLRLELVLRLGLGLGLGLG